MRFLRPGSLVSLDSGLWVVDDFQPVAAIIDPSSGTVLDVLSWPELPPAADRLRWPGVATSGDGSSLWTQQEPTGPLLRIGSDGGRLAAWTDGLQLSACGPDEAWCMPQPPDQELVEGKRSRPPALADRGLFRLLRVRSDGRQDAVMVNRPVRALHATAGALVVQVDDDPWRLRHLGAGTYEVLRTSRYLSLPWGAELPAQLDVPPDAVEQRPAEIHTPPSDLSMTWYEHTADPRATLHAAGLRWRLGSTWEDAAADRAPWFPIIAIAHDEDDAVVRRFELGPGRVVTARSIAGDTAVGVAVERRGPPRPVEVLSLSPGDDAVTTLLAAGAVDITDRCWPLVPRPLDADSYAAALLAVYRQEPQDGAASPLSEGVHDLTTQLVGEWPDTHLEWRFRWTKRPGVLLRRRIPLYDELGRLAPPEFAAVHLMERLETGAIPAASTARDGLLDF